MRNWGVINNRPVSCWSRLDLLALPRPQRQTLLAVRKEWERTPVAA